MPPQNSLMGCKTSFDRRELIFQQKLSRSWHDRTLPVKAASLR